MGPIRLNFVDNILSDQIEYMRSYYHFLLCKENTKLYPYSTESRVVVGEDHVDFSYQFVKNIYIYAIIKDNGISEYNTSIRDTSWKIIGPPTKFPDYGDFSGTFVMRTCGFDISTSPWQKDTFISGTYPNEPQDEGNIHCNYIDLEFHKAVYPIRISIYEVYNPGYVTQILAQDSDKCWVELWTGQPQIVPSTSRIFSPSLQSCDFKTKMLRLKFMFSYWDYSTHLEAVELIGTSKLILSKNPEQSLTNLLKSINCQYPCHGDIHNLTPYHKNAHLDIFNLQKKFLEYCIICKSDIAKNFYKSIKLEHKQVLQEEDVLSFKQGSYMNYHLLRDNSNYANLIKDMELYWNESQEQPRCSFSDALPDEIVLKILQNLDIRSLCRMSRVNKRLNNLTWDPFLLTTLNLRNMRYMHSICIYNIIFCLAPRCKFLQQLDLTSSNISVSHFVEFINICGGHLTNLRLKDCQFVNNSVLFEISKICKNLKVLDISYCYNEDNMDKGFSYLEDLEFLEDLNLGYTNMSFTCKSLCKILQKNRRMRYLNLSGIDYNFVCDCDMHSDAVLIQLRNSCPDLEVIDLTYNGIISGGIDALAECKNLRKLNISLNRCSEHLWRLLHNQ